VGVGKSLAKGAGVALGVTAGLVGAGYAAQRAVLRGLQGRPDPDAGHLPALPTDRLRSLASHDGGTIQVVEAGRADGPPIVLLHGLVIDSRIWVKQLASLPEHGFRVLAVDARGHGGSKCGDTGHSIENLTYDLRTVLEEYDLHDAIIVGHSMGGVAVQAFASHLPAVAHERVAGLVLLSSLAKTQVSTTRQLRALASTVSDRFDLSSLMANHDLGTLLARLGFGREPQASHVELVRQMLAECEPQNGREAIKVLLGVDLTPHLERIDLPTLIICGSADILTPKFESRRMARLIPTARMVMIEGAGHTIMLERPDELEDLLVEFATQLGVLPAMPSAATG
jgi:pimeloyl-ACP methyl ester carboxylesterase